MDWARVLAYVTGTVDQGPLARNEYLAAENRILKAKLKGRLKLSDAERATLGEIGHRLGRKAPPTSQLWRGPNYTTEASLVAVTLASYRCTFDRRVLTNPACGVRLFQVRFAPDSDQMRITSPQGIALAAT
jgi:hypothetical protein